MIKYKYLPIIKNKDAKGHVLTYTVIDEYGYKWEVNTLKEAKSHARIVDSAQYVIPKGAVEILEEFYYRGKKL